MAMMAPSNSIPRPVLIVVGLKAFQMMFSHMLVAMKRDMPEPRPYPFCKSSSKQMTMMPAMTSCSTISPAFNGPRSLTSPYIPETTYATASPKVMSTPRSFWAPSLHVAIFATPGEHDGSATSRTFARFVLPSGGGEDAEGEGRCRRASLLPLPTPSNRARAPSGPPPSASVCQGWRSVPYRSGWVAGSSRIQHRFVSSLVRRTCTFPRGDSHRPLFLLFLVTSYPSCFARRIVAWFGWASRTQGLDLL
mmetsp:Transcript_8121/g.50263  ORF Transcript_8121/g.50263 Transcript_8121/m.50263 type:complete len:249 (+) Transcript_8121:5413-6159(+)